MAVSCPRLVVGWVSGSSVDEGLEQALGVFGEPVADVEPPFGAEDDVLAGGVALLGHSAEAVGSESKEGLEFPGSGLVASPAEVVVDAVDQVPVVGGERAQAA